MRTVLFSVLALAPVLSARAEGVTFERKTPPGQELAVEESSLLEADVEVVHPDGLGGRGKTKGKIVEHKVRTYTQLIVEAPPKGPRTLELVFETATKETVKPPGKDRTKVNTSLHRKRMIVEVQGNTLVSVKPDVGTVTDEDKNDLLFAEKLYSTLPPGEVKPGKVWTIDAEAAGRALFGAAYDPSFHTVEGKCQLKGTTTSGGRKCAKVLVQLKASGRFADGNASIEMAPEGTLLFALEEGLIQSYELTGPLQLASGDKAGAFDITGSGKITLKYKVRVTDAGDEEPKGAKQGEGKGEGGGEAKR